MGAALAQAAAPEEILRFPAGSEPGSGAGQLRGPGPIGVDPANGHLFVADQINARVSEFTANGNFVKAWGWGVVASGPDNNPRNEVQEISLDATGGSFSLVFTNPLPGEAATRQTTAAIPFDAKASDVQAAFEQLESPSPGDIAVTGPDGGPWTIDFSGKYADTDIAPFEITSSTLSGGSGAVVNTIQDGANFETCYPAAGDVCRAGQSGGAAAGEFTGLSGIAVDPSGAVYVFDSFDNTHVGGELSARVQKFDPSAGPPGEESRRADFLLMIGGEVNKTTGANLCTAADLEAGNVCGAGVPGTGDAEFAGLSGGARLAFGIGPHLLVGDKERIEEFDTNGTFVRNIPVAGGYVRNMAVDASGNLYIVRAPADVTPDERSLDNIQKLGPNGELLTPEFKTISNPRAVIVDSSNNVYAIEDPDSFGSPKVDPRVVEFNASGAKIVPDAEEVKNKEFFAQKGTATLHGLATLLCTGAPPGALYVSDRTGHVSAYGSDPGCNPSPPAEPSIDGQFATSVDTSSAVVKAEINPHGQSTTYYVQYGLADCASNPCSEQPAAPGVSLGNEGQKAVLTAGVSLAGLSPDTVYHYRFCAQSSGSGDQPVCGVGGKVGVDGAGSSFITRRPAASLLPDERAYELVSPPQKNSGEVAPRGGTNLSLLQASPDGNRISYSSPTAFDDPKSAPATSQYLSEREEGGWATENITPPDQGGVIENGVRGFSSDLSTTAFVVREPPLCCNATPGVDNLYLRDNATGGLRLVTGAEPRLSIPRSNYCVAFGGATEDYERVIFSAFGALTPDAPEGIGRSLYEWTASEGIRLVSILPDGTPALPAVKTNFGERTESCKMGRSNIQHAISADGARIFWTFSGNYEGAQFPLFARLNGSETIQLDAPQGIVGAGGGGEFWAASADGSKVLFTDLNKLTPGANAGDLYLYDFDAPEGSRLSDLTAGPTAANVQGVMGASEAGDVAYFVATGVLAANDGAAVDPKTGDPAKAKAGQNNVYLWRAGQPLRYIATLSPGTVDNSNWQPGPEFRSPAVTADGQHLAFLSVEALTGYDNASEEDGKPVKEVYLYDAEADRLSCASCNPTGARPLGPSALTTWKVPFEQPRFLSADGGRLFFESFDALAEADVNGARDVYEFERPGVGDCTTASPTYTPLADGCLALISSGAAGSGNSYFLDASASGDDVFISTFQKLTGWDTDELYDAYDARVGGGFPEPPEPEEPCGEPPLEACPPPPPPAPAKVAPASGALLPGDPPPVHCKPGQVRRKGKCVRKPKHHKKAHHHKRANHRQGAGR
jgi:hypothetical protein